MISSHYNYTGHRNSYTELNEIYFWTITINNWNHLLKIDDNKMIVVCKKAITFTNQTLTEILKPFYCKQLDFVHVLDEKHLE